MPSAYAKPWRRGRRAEACRVSPSSATAGRRRAGAGLRPDHAIEPQPTGASLARAGREAVVTIPAASGETDRPRMPLLTSATTPSGRSRSARDEIVLGLDPTPCGDTRYIDSRSGGAAALWDGHAGGGAADEVEASARHRSLWSGPRRVAAARAALARAGGARHRLDANQIRSGRLEDASQVFRQLSRVAVGVILARCSRRRVRPRRDGCSSYDPRPDRHDLASARPFGRARS